MYKKGKYMYKRVEQGERLVIFHALKPRMVDASVLWVPSFVPRNAIGEMLQNLLRAHVVDLQPQVFSLPKGHTIGTTRYEARLAGVWPNLIPEKVMLTVNGERVPILFLVKGRPRTCFVCGSFVHSQAMCPNPKCRYCKGDHLVCNCPKKYPELLEQKLEAIKAAAALN